MASNYKVERGEEESELCLMLGLWKIKHIDNINTMLGKGEVIKMGLDIFASNTNADVRLTEQQEQAFADAEIQLCGGIFSCAESIFKGKVTHDIFADNTGVSLDQEWISPDKVKMVVACF